MTELVPNPSAHPSSQSKQQIDRFSRFCTAHGRVSLGTLAPPGEYDWTCASFGAYESTTQTAVSAQMMAESPYTLQWATLPPKLPLIIRGPGPHQINDSLAQSKPTIQRHHDCFSRFLHIWPQSVPILYNWMPLSPSKLGLSKRDLDPHLIHGCLDPPKSSNQMASRSVQPFLQGSLVWQADRPTNRVNRPRYSVCNNRPHLRT